MIQTVVLTDGEYEAVLALTRFGDKETWLFNGWKKNEKTGADGEVSTHSDATQANPTFSREDLGAVLSDAKLQKKVVKNNGFWKINAIRPVIKARRGRMRKFKLGQKANWGGLMKELGCQFVTQNSDFGAG